MGQTEDRLGRISGGAILDVATGTGQFINTLIESLKDYDSAIGVDFSETHISKARENNATDRISFEVMDAGALTFDDNQFDTVSISCSLHHMKDPAGVLREMYRVLKPGGLMICTEMYCDNQSNRQMIHVRLHHWWAAIDRINGISHNSTYRRDELVAMMDALGFTSREEYEEEHAFANPDEEQEAREYLQKVIDDYVTSIPEGDEHEAIRNEGRELRERLSLPGFDWASMVTLLGFK